MTGGVGGRGDVIMTGGRDWAGGRLTWMLLGAVVGADSVVGAVVCGGAVVEGVVLWGGAGTGAAAGTVVLARTAVAGRLESLLHAAAKTEVAAIRPAVATAGRATFNMDPWKAITMSSRECGPDAGRRRPASRRDGHRCEPSVCCLSVRARGTRGFRLADTRGHQQPKSTEGSPLKSLPAAGNSSPVQAAGRGQTCPSVVVPWARCAPTTTR